MTSQLKQDYKNLMKLDRNFLRRRSIRRGFLRSKRRSQSKEEVWETKASEIVQQNKNQRNMEAEFDRNQPLRRSKSLFSLRKFLKPNRKSGGGFFRNYLKTGTDFSTPTHSSSKSVSHLHQEQITKSEGRIKNFFLTPIRNARYSTIRKRSTSVGNLGKISNSIYHVSMQDVCRISTPTKKTNMKIDSTSAWDCDVMSSLRNPESPLKDLLRNKNKTESFRQFLRREHNDENLDFWLEVEKYRKLKLNKRRRSVGKIFETYIADNSERQINIDAQTRETMKHNLTEADKTVFDSAQDQIFHLMEKDPFTRFLAEQKPN